MATEDRNGDLHSECNGRFVSKNKSDEEKRKDAERVYNTHGHLSEIIPLPERTFLAALVQSGKITI